jgi:hypothetical protein
MATISRKSVGTRLFGGSGAPYGDATHEYYKLETNASGAVVDSDSTAAVASGDVIRVGKLLAGFRLDDIKIIVETAWTATVVGKVGFLYADGVDDTGVPQNDAYFATGLTIATAGVYRAAVATAPVILAKDAWLTVTTGTAANAKASATHFIVSGVLQGPK